MKWSSINKLDLSDRSPRLYRPLRFGNGQGFNDSGSTFRNSRRGTSNRGRARDSQHGKSADEGLIRRTEEGEGARAEVDAEGIENETLRRCAIMDAAIEFAPTTTSGKAHRR